MSILMKLVGMLNGWKSIIGFLVMEVSKLVAASFPGAPVAELAVVLQFFGEALLALGLSHKAVKELKDK